MARQNIAAGNWKMNTTVSEGKDLYKALSNHSVPEDVTVIVGVPFLHIGTLLSIKHASIKIAAQNCHFKNSGAYTGETSPSMLADIGVDYVILGHSERREYFHEDNAMLAQKLDAALENKLKVIFCCGEPLEIRKQGTQNAYVSKQLEEGLFHLTADQLKDVVIAYEPIWAIGTGETASPEQAQDMHAHIRSILTNKYGNDAAQDMSILYGGSVKPGNAKEIFGKEDVDGGLVGGASLKADSFGAIIDSF
ncbi:MAG: triose-phosphate isomerase [Saprospiraceae bacterium]|nr:triose-phosphate isomerase [Saprospiraceae bacterium]